MEAQSFVDKFTEYVESHLSGNEANNVKDDPKAKAWPKLSNMKPDLTFVWNSKWEVLLPQDCLDLKLEDKKHVFWCFLKSQYGESTHVQGVIAQTLRFSRTCKGCVISWILMYSTLGKAG